MLSIGLMTGTSMDGIDAALLDTDGQDYIIEIGYTSLPYDDKTRCLLKSTERAIQQAKGHLSLAAKLYPQSLRDYLQEELQIETTHLDKTYTDLANYIFTTLQDGLSLASIVKLSTRLHAKVVEKLLHQTHKQAEEITVIGYHGQTMYHHPEEKITVQIGEGGYLAELTRITVVKNFRQADIAAGGQGAPFAPLYHLALAKRDNMIPLAVVNCGGIANLTLIMSEHLDNLIALDTGPGNGLIDALIRQRTQGKASMDKDGQYGSKGQIHASVLEALFEKAVQQKGLNYLLKAGPKSLDIRDLYLIPLLNSLSLEDACATLEAFTAKTIVDSLDSLPLPLAQLPRRWILAGGGWYNPVIKAQLMTRLHAKLGKDVIIQTATEAGWNHDAMEAQAFAYLAVRSLKKLPLSVPGTTHVLKPLSGGEIYHYTQ